MLIKIAKAQANLVPLHTHDCDDCVYLGQVGLRDRQAEQTQDVWYCPGEKTLILRFGRDGDYMSFSRAFPFEDVAGEDPLHDALSLLCCYETDDCAVCELEVTPEDESPWDEDYITLVGLYQDLRVRESDKGTLFYRDFHGNPLGVGVKVNDDSWEFRPHEDLRWLVNSDARSRIVTGKKSLNLYVLFLLQQGTDTGH